MPRLLVAVLCLLFSSVFLRAQEVQFSEPDSVGVLPDDSTKVNLLLEISQKNTSSVNDCIGAARAAQQLADRIGYIKGAALAYKRVGVCLYRQGNLSEAIDSWTFALKNYQRINDVNGEANILSNIGAAFVDMGDNVKGLEYFFNALRLAEKTGNKLRKATTLLNIGAAYFDNPLTKEKALPYYVEAVELSEEIDDKEAIGVTLANIGEIYYDQQNYEKALFYFEKSKDLLDEARAVNHIPSTLGFMGKIYAANGNFVQGVRYHKEAYSMAVANKFDLETCIALSDMAVTYHTMKDYENAQKAYLEAKAIAERIGSLKELKKIYQGLADVSEGKKDFSKAVVYQRLLSGVKDSLYQQENVKIVQRFQFEFDLEKKEAQINLLTKDKEIQEVNLQKQRNKIYALVAGACLLVGLAFFQLKTVQLKTRANTLLSQRNAEINQQKEEIAAQRDDIETQKKEIEGLILNILPLEVAQELRKNGVATPRYYEEVTVLFTDFKDFTKISETLTAQDLVAQLNNFFVAFDRIVEQYSLEKIKTIGDAYMCASGIPTPDPMHAHNAVRAALAIQRFIDSENEKRPAGQARWQLRVGIHTGPVVAGVVGLKKYAYDIWGSTVNIANRLESSGEIGRVNISSTTYELVKETFRCEYRGKVSAKNMEDVDMYFVAGEMTEA